MINKGKEEFKYLVDIYDRFEMKNGYKYRNTFFFRKYHLDTFDKLVTNKGNERTFKYFATYVDRSMNI